MSKKSKKKVSAAAPSAAPPRRPRRFALAASALAACAMLAAFAATRYSPARRAVGPGPLPAPAAQQGAQAPLPLSKEYVYAGSRLVATEEPGFVPAGPPPLNLRATATSAASVSLEWDAPAAGGGTVVGYVVERRGTLAQTPVEIQTGNAGRLFNDSTQTGDYAYLYRVRAVYAGGYSAYGNYDLATTVPFTDTSLQGVVIQAAHLTELRRAVKAVRTLAGKGEPAWSYPDPVSTPAAARRLIYLADVADLRRELDQALTGLDQALGVQTFFKSYPDHPALAARAPVYAAHFEQIRERVR